MKKVSILTCGFTNPNGCAFLMPLILHKKAMNDIGIEVNLFHEVSDDVFECDYLGIESKFLNPRWESDSQGILDDLVRYREKVGNLIYFNILDSSGWDHVKVLPHVTLYCKSQLLSDRNAYTKRFYGNRIFSDFYHNRDNVIDDNPEYSEAIEDPTLLNKLMVSWHSGLADYSWLGPYRMMMYEKLPIRSLLRFPKRFKPPSATRKRDLSLRVGTSYQRDSVAHHRRLIADKLRDRLDSKKVSRRQYIAELENSKAVISPFGLGEITLRDFEVFMAGSLLIKPDMSHMDTWPNLFVGGETMQTFKWDLSDLEEVLERSIQEYDSLLDVARQGQDRYYQHLCGPEAGHMFASHFDNILKRCQDLSSEDYSRKTTSLTQF